LNKTTNIIQIESVADIVEPPERTREVVREGGIESARVGASKRLRDSDRERMYTQQTHDTFKCLSVYKIVFLQCRRTSQSFHQS